jgi:hypothetical protein
MPNDAKLGLLVGVVGVLAAAVLFSSDRPSGAAAAAPASNTVAVRSAVSPASTLPSTQVAIAADRGQTPSMPTAFAGARTKPEIEATPTARKNKRGEN